MQGWVVREVRHSDRDGTGYARSVKYHPRVYLSLAVAHRFIEELAAALKSNGWEVRTAGVLPAVTRLVQGVELTDLVAESWEVIT